VIIGFDPIANEVDIDFEDGSRPQTVPAERLLAKCHGDHGIFYGLATPNDLLFGFQTVDGDGVELDIDLVGPTEWKVTASRWDGEGVGCFGRYCQIENAARDLIKALEVYAGYTESARREQIVDIGHQAIPIEPWESIDILRRVLGEGRTEADNPLDEIRRIADIEFYRDRGDQTDGP
jgi:hypothetical protein